MVWFPEHQCIRADRCLEGEMVVPGFCRPRSQLGVENSQWRRTRKIRQEGQSFGDCCGN